MKGEYLAEKVTAAINDDKVYKVEFNSDGSGVRFYFYTLTGDEVVSLQIETFIECIKGKQFSIKETTNCF